MPETSGHVLEMLWEDEELVLFRTPGDGGELPFLASTPASAQPAPESLARLRHAYALRDELDPAWAARPSRLELRGGRLALLSEDPGGELLSRLQGRPWEIGSFLRVAVGLATALGRLHEQGLIHKDVKPANILADAATGAVWLTGFGIASRLPRERQVPAPPEIIAGTLAYMAPEQTGRMNRSIDSRSDLYACGVTLYEMIAGTLPFSASDPMDWIHCHIARQPAPPSERVGGIPAAVEAIILRLLAKPAEDRYQTAAGLRTDLLKCLVAWEAYRRIDPFPLGANDVSDRLLMPEKLYGRAAEIDTLVEAFDRVVARGSVELVLVSGWAGIGKSSVVNELHKLLVPPRGLFAAGKFDQFKRDIPYATLAQAFQSLVRRILGRDETELGRWRRDLEQALGSNGQLMVNLIPELVAIIGEQPAIPDLPPQEAQIRFQMVFRRFLGVFARPEHPLALFLDDLQWLDAATLELLERLAVDPDVRHVLLVGAYRDNEVGPSHPLTRTLAQIRSAGGSIHEIVLAPLAPDDVEQLVADALHTEPGRVRSLAELVYGKTAGNAFFVIQFITALAESGLIAFDSDASAWRWDIDRIRAEGFTDNVADLMAAKLSRLAVTTQEALGMLACLGNVAEIGTLDMVCGEAKDAVHAALWQAIRAGLLYTTDGAYAFIHDRVQEAAYALIPESDRAMAHLRIGRLLASRTAPQEREDKIFDIVNQLDRGAALITAPEERERVAELNLVAARRAKAATAYAAALQYCSVGRGLLGDETQGLNYRLAFDLELNWAECEYLTGSLASAEGRLSALSVRAETIVDSAAVACVRLNLYTLLDQSDRAVVVGLDYLRRVDSRWPAHATIEDVHREYDRLWRGVGDRSIEALLDLPAMTDPELSATMDVLTAFTSPAFFTDENLFRLVVGRMATLSVEHGPCDGSCLAFAWLGGVIGTYFGDYQSGTRFGRLGVDLVEKHGLDRFSARVYLVFAVHVANWTESLSTGRAYLRRAFAAALRAGDLSYAAYSCADLNTNLLGAGDSLVEVEREAENGLEIIRRVRFGLVIHIAVTQLRLIRILRRRTEDLAGSDDATFDEGSFEQRLENDPRLATAACYYWIRKLQACVFMGDAPSGIAAAAKAAPLLWTSPTQFELVEYHFYGAIARAAACDTAAADERAEHREALAAHHRLLEIWAKNCPTTFVNRAALVGAEIARLSERPLDAERLYEEAIRSARANGFVQNEGVASERAANFYAARGFETISDAYLRNARYCYLRWGAEGKVQQLELLHPHLRESPGSASATTTIGASVGQLDAGAVIRASHAVSGEIVLDRLIETLMRIALEYAGAQRGLLILMQRDTPRIEAEAKTDQERVEVTVRQAAVTSADMPESLLHTVIRIRQSVILEDASVEEPFSADEYIRRKRARSVLCMPLVKQTKLIGVLYLENNLASHVFTPARASLLELLASQAAISLENARLYGELMMSEERWRNLFESVPVGVALIGSDRCYIAANPAFQQMTGYSEEELRRLSPTDITFEGDRAAADAIIAANSAARRVEKRYRRKDGEVIWAEVDYFLALVAGSGPFLAGVAVDITERKRAEEALRDAQADLAHMARLTTMGELTASIAHEINHPLAAVALNADTCLRYLNRDEPDLDRARAAALRIQQNIGHATEVIRGLRTLAKKTGHNPIKLDIDEVIREALTLADGEFRRHDVVLLSELAAGDRPVLGDRVQLQQVLLNLIINGLQAMKEVTERARELTISSTFTEPSDVLIAIKDTGTGLDPAVAKNMFQPFFTTKPDGLGIGLSICRSIVEAHGGRLWASPRAPFGADVRFTVPTSFIPADLEGSTQ
jgi:PAS domain S-box-containing protein